MSTEYELTDDDGLTTIVAEIFSILEPRPFVVRLPNGQKIEPSPGAESSFEIYLRRPSALRRMFLPFSELHIGEGYIFGDYDIRGDLVHAFEVLDNLSSKPMTIVKLVRVLWRFAQLARYEGDASTYVPSAARKDESFSSFDEIHTLDRDKAANQFHYDLSNDFYRTVLDRQMVYSSAYFLDRNHDIHTAQEDKLDLICRKLDLRPGERLLDVGCGWGGLLIHSAMNYGVYAVGISVSEAQTEEALARIRAAGLSHRCQIEICHYDAYRPAEPFDKVASIGMFEHVGKDKLDQYMRAINTLVRPCGLFLLQGATALVDRANIERNWKEWLGIGRGAFFQKYIFPDSYLHDLPSILAVSERAGFEARDVECLREHYALTVKHWLKRLEDNNKSIVADVGESAYRRWRLLMAFSIYFMKMWLLGEYQLLFAKSVPGCEAPVTAPRVSTWRERRS